MTQPDAPRPRSIRDNWWWSGVLWAAGGGAIVWYQRPVLVGEMEGFWGNWVMAALGLVISVVGVLRLYRDWRLEQARQDNAYEPDTRTGRPED